MAARPITPEEAAHVDELVGRGRAALAAFEDATQEQVDRLCQAVAWAVANEATFTRLAHMGVEESGIGDPDSRVGKRFKVMGILRDVLRQKSIGVIEELPERGIVKYAKPVGLIASLVPTTNPELTPPGVGMFAIKCRDAVIFSPHPRSKNTTRETVAIMRRALGARGCAGRPYPVHREGQHPHRPVPDDAGRHGPGDRREGHGEGRVQLGHARLRGRLRQLDHGHRRDGRHRRGRAQHPPQQDVRLRVRLLGGRQSRRGVDASTTRCAIASSRRAAT